MIVDRRADSKNKSVVNRQRFLRRFKHQLKRAVNDAASERSIKEIDKGEKVSIPTRDLSEPHFSVGEGGRRDIVHPGNKEFTAGDRIKRPRGGAGGRWRQGQQGRSGRGRLRLRTLAPGIPRLACSTTWNCPEPGQEGAHAPARLQDRPRGITLDGTPEQHQRRALPARLDLARRIAMGRPACAASFGSWRRSSKPWRTAKTTTDERDCPGAAREDRPSCAGASAPYPSSTPSICAINHRVKQPQPSTKAVMFCLMDVSGSMTQERKDLAKQFFILLYLFLQRNYDKIEVVFIRHHTGRQEVDEDEFFHSRETGGTVVSSALNLTPTTSSRPLPE
jgi:hypothetical protein